MTDKDEIRCAKLAKLLTWFVILAVSGIVAVSFFNVVFP
jgi:hypothetical protein